MPDEKPKYSAEELNKVVLKYTVADSTKPPVDKVQYIDKLKPITLAQSEIHPLTTFMSEENKLMMKKQTVKDTYRETERTREKQMNQNSNRYEQSMLDDIELPSNIDQLYDDTDVKMSKI